MPPKDSKQKKRSPLEIVDDLIGEYEGEDFKPMANFSVVPLGMIRENPKGLVFKAICPYVKRTFRFFMSYDDMYVPSKFEKFLQKQAPTQVTLRTT